MKESDYTKREERGEEERACERESVKKEVKCVSRGRETEGERVFCFNTAVVDVFLFNRCLKYVFI